MITLGEDESFSLTANVMGPGYQTIALQGYLIKHKDGETYVAPLLPRMFYGVDGNQLGATWRQNFTQAGEQVVLSRMGGQPKVGEPDIYWKKIASTEVPKEAVSLTLWDQAVAWWNGLSTANKIVTGLSVVSSVITVYLFVRNRGR